MRRKWRPILATILVLAFAAFEYVHWAGTPIDLGAMPLPRDEDHPELSDLPADVRALDDRLVCVEGFMIPMDQAYDIQQFAVVPRLSMPEGGPQPAITHTIAANYPTGVSYCPGKVHVLGRLRIHKCFDDGFLVSLMEMDVENVIPVYDCSRSKWPYAAIGGVVVLVILWPFWRRRRRLRLAGHCLNCGYDLRATPARCPECGVEPSR